MKVLGIIEDNPITGVKYGMVEQPCLGTPINRPDIRKMQDAQQRLHIARHKNRITIKSNRSK